MTDYRLTDALPKLIAYYRVSTDKQKQSGLGLQAQEAAVAKTYGTILRAYTEIESGKKNDRPELMKALADCRRSKATLVIARLDRLSRNVHFLSGLMEAGVEFICADAPALNKLTLHVLAAVAENEARLTSERTKAALSEFKANKVVPQKIRELYNGDVPAEIVEATAGKLGSARTGRKFKREEVLRGVAASAVANAAEAKSAYADLSPIALSLRAEGKSLREIAAHFNTEGYSTRGGREWHATTISRVLKYAA